MRSIVAFVLGLLMLLGSLVPNNDLGELAKLPELAKHYRFHRSPAGGSLSFSEFMVEHYGAGTKHYSGCSLSEHHQDDHHNLPLRCHHGCAAVSFVVVPVTRLVFAAQPITAQLPAYRVAAAPRYAGPVGTLPGQPPRA